jgi:transposase-like protein
MKHKRYSDEFKEQVIKECRQIGNTALVARRHDISYTTVYTWYSKAKKNGSVKSLPKDKKKQYKEVKKRLNKLGTENDQLKKLLAEKELELAILRDLRDQSNPQ